MMFSAFVSARRREPGFARAGRDPQRSPLAARHMPIVLSACALMSSNPERFGDLEAPGFRRGPTVQLAAQHPAGSRGLRAGTPSYAMARAGRPVPGDARGGPAAPLPRPSFHASQNRYSSASAAYAASPASTRSVAGSSHELGRVLREDAATAVTDHEPRPVGALGRPELHGAAIVLTGGLERPERVRAIACGAKSFSRPGDELLGSSPIARASSSAST